MRIVVSTNPDRRHWLSDFINSVPDEHINDVEVHCTRGFEPSAIRGGFLTSKGRQRFLFFQDSVVLKDLPGIIRAAESHPTALILPRPSCYMALYNTEVLGQMWWPDIKPDDKEESIRNETLWMDAYEAVARRHFGINELPVVFPELTDRRAIDDNNIKYVHGERRLHLENAFLSKRKGTWR